MRLEYINYLCWTLFISSNWCNPVLGQIAVDGSTNTNLSTINNEVNINNGDRIGNNLFHSFSEFSIPNGGSASFDNAIDVENIFSRVTGGDISNIDGAINANGGANLMLINPAGIVFGENASLNIGGSFFATTADSLLFESGEFSAVDPQAAPILTINRPIGLNFGESAGDIVNRSTANDVGLQVSNGETINSLGGNVQLQGGLITAPGGQINLGGLSEMGTIGINEDGSLSFPNDVEKSNVFLSNNAVVNLVSDGGGSIKIDVNSLELTQQSIIQAGIGKDVGSENAVGGSIIVNGSSVSADDSSLIRSNNNGIGRAGAIAITTDSLNLTSNAAITASTFGAGDAGTIDLTARNITLEQDFTGIYSNVGLTRIAADEQDVAGVVGNGGIVNINTVDLTLLDGARINSNSIAQGNAGTININAAGNILYQGVGTIPVPAFGGGTTISGSFSQVQQDGIGNAGQINITASSFDLIDLGAVLADNSGLGGNAGNITIDVANRLFLDQTGLILAQVQEGAVGNGGDININAGSLESYNNSLILADTKGMGNAGNITIDVDETIVFSDRTVILTEVGENAIGDAGDINISGKNLIVDGFSDITSQTKGQGNAGNITLNIEEAILLDTGKILSQSLMNVDGDAGDIIIDAEIISLVNFGKITNSALLGSTGEAGEIVINADNITIAEGSVIDALSENNFDSGNINLTATNLELNTGGKILVTNDGGGNAGNINLNITDNIILNNGNPPDDDIFREPILQELKQETGLFASNSTTSSGSGGSVFVTADSIEFIDRGSISASTFSGGGGNIDLQIENALSLRNNSLISAEASGVGNGGNVNIDADVIIAFDNGENGNDIVAKAAAEGAGGNINIATNAILGLQARNAIPLNRTNDIDASSQFGLDGTVAIDNPDVDPTSGIVELPSVPIDAESILARDLCKVENETVAGGSSFIITGKGGLTPTSAESLGNINRVVNWVDESDLSINQDDIVALPKPNKNNSVVRAQGFAIAPDGSMWLTANVRDPIWQSSPSHPNCQS